MSTSKFHYGIRYYSNETTTFGDANKITGRYSIACELKIFSTKEELKRWLDHDLYNKKRAVTKKELRKHFLGMSVADFEEMLHNETIYSCAD